MKMAGSDGTIKTATNLIGQMKAWSLSVSTSTLDASALGTTWREKLAMSLRDWSGSLEGFFDFDDAGQAELNVGDTVELNFYYESETSTNNYVTGNAIIVTMERSAALDGMHEVTFSFEGTGELADAVVV